MEGLNGKIEVVQSEDQNILSSEDVQNEEGEEAVEAEQELNEENKEENDEENKEEVNEPNKEEQLEQNAEDKSRNPNEEIINNVLSVPSLQTGNSLPPNINIDPILSKKQRLLEISQEIDEINKSININNLSKVDASKNENLNPKSKPALRLMKNLQNKKSDLENKKYKLFKTEQSIREETNINPMGNLNNSLSEIDLNIKKSKMKQIRNSKEVLDGKINEIQNQIDKIIDKERQIPREDRLKKFLNDFERSKFETELNTRQYQEDFEKKLQEKQLKQSQELEMMIKEKENMKQQREDGIRKEAHDKLKKVEDKRRENNSKIIEELKKFKDCVPEPNKRLKTYEDLERDYKANESKRISMELIRRKEKVPDTSLRAITEFQKEYKLIKQQSRVDNEINQLKLKQIWKERRELSPVFHSNYLENIKREGENIKLKEEMKNLKIKQLLQKQKCYGTNISQPCINSVLKEKRNMEIKLLNNPRKKIELTRLNLENRKMAMYQVQRPTKMMEQNNAEIIANKKKVKILKPLERSPDYLTEERLKKEEKGGDNSGNIQVPKKSWEKLMNEKDYGKFQTNLSNIQNNIGQAEEKLRKKKQLYQIGSNKKTENELNLEISDYYIQVLQDKLKLINAVENFNSQPVNTVK
ncbi:MAG: hypothetical protein MJ252_25855 [archaeon]|nr:hypothetical protein [archaeon]